MKIYTSYFARISRLPPDVIPISIALYPPRGYKGYRYTKLAPTKQILSDYKNGCSVAEYTDAYRRDVLSKLDQKTFVENLESYFGGKDVCLICYEKSGNFCHRRLVADWLREAGYHVEEWQPEGSQMSLFADNGWA